VAVKIKLKRLGRTRVPTYRIVVADARTKRDGRAIEEIGKYHPKEEPSLIEVNSERAQHWLSVGALPTEPVLALFKITGDWQKFKGEPGAEGTLRTKEPAADKKERFADALKDAAKDDAATGPKGGSRARKSSDAAKADTARADTARAESGRSKSRATAETAAPSDAGSAADRAATAASEAAPGAAEAPPSPGAAEAPPSAGAAEAPPSAGAAEAPPSAGAAEVPPSAGAAEAPPSPAEPASSEPGSGA
jgi:small subunit ribosomal protein S16